LAHRADDPVRHQGLADSWQGCVNSGLMALLFLVADLKARDQLR